MKLQSARQAIHDACTIHLRNRGLFVCMPELVATHKGQKTAAANADWQICDAVEAGMILAALAKLPTPVQAWAIWAYGPETPEYQPDKVRLFRWLVADLEQRLSQCTRQYRPATCKKIREVVMHTVFDFKHFMVSEKHRYPVPEIIRRCGIQRQNWTRDFQCWHSHYWDCCDQQLDRQALQAVAQVVYRLRG